MSLFLTTTYLVQSLEAQGHIVIASISSSDAMYEIEKAGKG